MLNGELRMTGSGSAIIAQASAAAQASEGSEWVETRFGKVKLQRSQSVMFPNGMLGLPDKMQFCLTRFPSEKMERFLLLQSLDEASLSFITLPLDLKNPIIDQVDILQAASDLEIAPEALALLLIVSVHRDMSGIKLSVNARAPLLVNAQNRTASQFVFSSNKYEIRHLITL
ncbi:MAG: flagellar assembly protein FliW [Alphaproteobacteria bacterium]